MQAIVNEATILIPEGGRLDWRDLILYGCYFDSCGKTLDFTGSKLYGCMIVGPTIGGEFEECRREG